MILAGLEVFHLSLFIVQRTADLPPTAVLLWLQAMDCGCMILFEAPGFGPP